MVRNPPAARPVDFFAPKMRAKWRRQLQEINMPCSKETIAALKKHGIDGQVEPYIGVIRFFCLHFFPVDEIVSQIVLASDLLKLIAMLPDGDLFSDAERSLAVKLLREGKSVADVFKQIRPNTSPKASAP